jgi:hypothetical protein
MGYKIWRRDNNIWNLAFDTIFKTEEIVSEYILELNATYNNLVKFGELEFRSYKDDIKLAKDGKIIEKRRYVKNY